MHGVLLLRFLVVEVDLRRVSSYFLQPADLWTGMLSFIFRDENVRLPKYIPITDFPHFHLVCHMLHMLHALMPLKIRHEKLKSPCEDIKEVKYPRARVCTWPIHPKPVISDRSAGALAVLVGTSNMVVGNHINRSLRFIRLSHTRLVRRRPGTNNTATNAEQRRAR